MDQAFVGWTHEPRSPIGNDDWDEYGQMLGVLFGAWMEDQPLRNCLSMASKTDPYGDGSVILQWPLGLHYNAWQTYYGLSKTYVNNFKLTVYGYDGITRKNYQ